MAKIISIHELEPAQGANQAEFEAFLQELANGEGFETEGWKAYVVKGDRGERLNKFALIHEFESIDTRNRYFPTEGGEMPEETMQAMNSFGSGGMGERWGALIEQNDTYTDYIFPD